MREALIRLKPSEKDGGEVPENDPGDEERGTKGLGCLYPPLPGRIAVHGHRKRRAGSGQAASRGAGSRLHPNSPSCRAALSTRRLDAFQCSYPGSANKSDAPVQERRNDLESAWCPPIYSHQSLMVCPLSAFLRTLGKRKSLTGVMICAVLDLMQRPEGEGQGSDEILLKREEA